MNRGVFYPLITQGDVAIVLLGWANTDWEVNMILDILLQVIVSLWDQVQSLGEIQRNL